MSRDSILKKFPLFILSLSFFVACSTSSHKKEVSEASPEARKQFQKGLALLKGKKPLDGVNLLNQLSKNYPNSEASYQGKIVAGDYFYLKAEFG